MNQGPPAPHPHHQQHHPPQGYQAPYYPPPTAPAPHNPPSTPQPCFNCGQTTHWAQNCPEPRRNVPVGAAQQKQPRNRAPKGGPGPIITRYPPPQHQQHAPHYQSSPYGAPPPPQSPAHAAPYPQQPYAAPYGVPPPPPPPPPHAIPPHQVHSPHYPPPPPPPPPPQPYPPYHSPVNGQYQAPPYASPYPPQQPSPPPPAPHAHHQAPFYPPPPPHQPYAPPTYRTPIPQPPPGPYQFYPHQQPPTAPHYQGPAHPHGPPPPHHARHNHRQHSGNHHPPAPQPRPSISEPAPTSPASGPIIWRPAQRSYRPFASTFEESEEQDDSGTGWENPLGSISKYWNPDGTRTKAHPKLSDFIDDPALRSFNTGVSRLLDIYGSDEEQEAGDAAMELGSNNSDVEDTQPDVTDKLNGILSRQSSEQGRANTEDDHDRRRSSRDNARRESRDSSDRSPRRGRSKSPANEDSTYASYRSRTPSGETNAKKGRSQHALPAKPDSTTAQEPVGKSVSRASHTKGSADVPSAKGSDGTARSRSASPRRGSEDEKRRHRDYDRRTGETSQQKEKSGKDAARRRSSAANGVPAVFGRRW